MISRAFKLRFRRRLRIRKLQVEEFGQHAEQQLERNFFRRLERLADVRRFVATWIILLVLLAGCVIAQIGALGAYYQMPVPAAGGTYTEGILGSFTNANPLYAASPVDSAVSKLVFSSLLTYDGNNNLVGDLAQDLSVDDRGTTYTVRLRPHLTWQDGQPLTADDVAFTYQLIQNPDARSPLNPSWQGIAVKAVDPQTITFTLPNPLSSFPYSLTNGIVPKHLLQGQPMDALRTLPFNTVDPIGSGPFKLSTLEVTGNSADNREENIGLVPFSHYHAGAPQLSHFVIRSFRDQQLMVSSYKSQEINAMVGLTAVPAGLDKDASTRVYNLPLTAAVMTFFRVSQGVLADTTVRQALVRATNQPAIIKSLDYPTLPVREPLLQNQLGYNPAYIQAGYDLATANKLLDGDGWIMGSDGIRHKNGVPLSFTLYAQNNTEYAMVANELHDQWHKIGVDMQVMLQNGTDFQSTLAFHNYDALLYGISIGKDPDVYVYWNSKQADIRSVNRLNFSEYKSSTADASLQAGRTRSDPALRIIKYQSFLQAWQTDVPAVGLYQPRFLYITRGAVYGLNEHAINAETDRFDNVQNWMVRVVKADQVK